MHSVGGRRSSRIFGFCVVANVTPLFEIYVANFARKTAIAGQFGWGGTLLKRFWVLKNAQLYINSAQRLAQLGQKSSVECKGKSQPDWIHNIIESRIEILA